MLGVAAGTVVLSGTGIIQGCKAAGEGKMETGSIPKYKQYKNDNFYGPDGTFDAETAKQAYFEMMGHFNYPIIDRLKGEDFWVTDFGLGNFSEIGLGGIIWLNDPSDNYVSIEIFLLPGQRIAEHGHDKTEKTGPKLESWMPRYGMVYVYGEGEPTPGAADDIPESEKPYWIAKTKKRLLPGDIGKVEKATTMHWMYAGSEGAIVTETGTFHDGDGIKFSNPNTKF